MTARYFIILFIAALLTFTSLGMGRHASAALSIQSTYPVTKTEDTNDGVCDSDCSLREAVIAANNGFGNAVIDLPPGTFTLTLAGAGENNAATGDLDIKYGIEIYGEGIGETVIDGNGLDRVFHIHNMSADHQVLITGLSVRNGSAANSDGGGIRNEGNLTLNTVEVSGNSAINSSGAGIANLGDLRIEQSIVRGNHTADSLGGGIHNNAGSVLLDESIIAENTARIGGGIYNINSSAILEISHSTISGNQALGNDSGYGGSGGGIENQSNGVVIMVNVTLTGNRARGYGGAIFNGSNNTVMNLTNVTIAGNVSDPTQGNSLNGGGIYNSGDSTNLSMKNTLIAGNQGENAPDCKGTVASEGYNLIGDGANCSGLVDGTNGDQVGSEDSPINPRLAPLKNYGGSTDTMALYWGSPAIDAGHPDFCPPLDQRKQTRPTDGDGDGVLLCDIGAFEGVLYPVFLPALIR